MAYDKLTVVFKDGYTVNAGYVNPTELDRDDAGFSAWQWIVDQALRWAGQDGRDYGSDDVERVSLCG